MTTKGTPKKDDATKRAHAAKLPREIATMVKQEGRCQAWADRLNAVAKKGLKKEQEKEFETLNEAERLQILQRVNPEIKEEHDLKELMFSVVKMLMSS